MHHFLKNWFGDVYNFLGVLKIHSASPSTLPLYWGEGKQQRVFLIRSFFSFTLAVTLKESSPLSGDGAAINTL